MSAIIEMAGRTTCDDISGGGGGIASTLLWNGSVERRSISYRIHGSNYFARSFFRTEQSDSDQDDVQVGHDTRQLMDLQTKTNFLFRMDGRQLMGLPIKIF